MPAARRDIDPETGDYIVERGRPRADSSRASKVVLRLRKRRGTGCKPNLGSRLHLVTSLVPGALRLAEHYAHEALEDLSARGEIRRVKVVATAGTVQGTTWLVVDVSFVDTDGDPRTVQYKRRVGG